MSKQADQEVGGEFVVMGTPVSQQTRHRARLKPWIDNVAAAVVENGLASLRDLPAKVAITYYYERTDLDLDNLLKPILDALKRTVIDDDKFVVELLVRKRTLAAARLRSGLSMEVATALISGQEFVHIQVDVAEEGVS